jgi:hypothetical protein
VTPLATNQTHPPKQSSETRAKATPHRSHLRARRSTFWAFQFRCCSSSPTLRRTSSWSNTKDPPSQWPLRRHPRSRSIPTELERTERWKHDETRDLACAGAAGRSRAITLRLDAVAFAFANNIAWRRPLASPDSVHAKPCQRRSSLVPIDHGESLATDGGGDFDHAVQPEAKGVNVAFKFAPKLSTQMRAPG